MVVFEGVLN